MRQVQRIHWMSRKEAIEACSQWNQEPDMEIIFAVISPQMGRIGERILQEADGRPEKS